MTMHKNPDSAQMYESDFYRVFDRNNKHWSGPLNNETYLRMMSNYLNNVLADRGYLFLNDVYDALGFPRIPEGQLIGWFYSEGPTLEMLMTEVEDGAVRLEFNVIRSDVMYFKI